MSAKAGGVRQQSNRFSNLLARNNTTENLGLLSLLEIFSPIWLSECPSFIKKLQDPVSGQTEHEDWEVCVCVCVLSTQPCLGAGQARCPSLLRGQCSHRRDVLSPRLYSLLAAVGRYPRGELVISSASLSGGIYSL